MTNTVVINCDGIYCSKKFTTIAPDNWVTEHAEYGGEDNTVFCPDCASQNNWFRAVCPGCVGGFPDCDLAKAFMFDSSPGISGAEALAIEKGTCPFRVNGTMSFTAGEGIKDIDISDLAPAASGLAVINAIQAYEEEYNRS